METKEMKLDTKEANRKVNVAGEEWHQWVSRISSFMKL